MSSSNLNTGGDTMKIEAMRNATQNVPNDGTGTEELSADEVAQFKTDLLAISSSGFVLQSLRWSNASTRYCVWDGQSDDGLKHADDLGEPANPFEGAPDSRVRMVDTAVRKLCAKMVQAVKRATMTFTAEGESGEAFAENMDALASWIKRRWTAQAYGAEIKKAANYYFDESPAGYVLFTGWRHEMQMRLRTVKVEDVAEWLFGNFSEGTEGTQGTEGEEPEIPDEDMQLVQAYFTDPSLNDQAVNLLSEVLPETVSQKALRRMVRELRETGETKLPTPEIVRNEPEIPLAMRLFEDAFVPVNTVRNIQRSRVVYIRRWLTAAQIHEIGFAEKWSEEFIAELLSAPEDQSDYMGGKNAGMSGLPVPWGTVNQAQTPLSQGQGLYFDFRHLYEVVWAYTVAMNEDGIPGVYVTPFSFFVEKAAKARELYECGHGGLPVVYVQREIVNDRLLDSRSLSQIGQSEQRLCKTFTDVHASRAQFDIPPWLKPDSMEDDAVLIKPFAGILYNRDKPEWFKLPEATTTPAAADYVERRFRDYWGLWHKENDPAEAAILLQEDVDNFLSGWAAAWHMVLQDCRKFLEEEQCERIFAGKCPEGFGDSYDTEFEFSVEMEMDEAGLSFEKAEKMIDTFGTKILPLDLDQRIDRGELTGWLTSLASPSAARRIMRPLKAANQREMDDEDDALSSAMTGIEKPLMDMHAQNHALRLDRLKQQVAKPAIAARLAATPDAFDIVNRRMENHQFALQQIKNKTTGKIGVVPADANEE